jgi:hypothetical protein
MSIYVQNLQYIRIIIVNTDESRIDTVHVPYGYTIIHIVWSIVSCHTCLLTQGIISSVFQLMWVQGEGGARTGRDSNMFSERGVISDHTRTFLLAPAPPSCYRIMYNVREK